MSPEDIEEAIKLTTLSKEDIDQNEKKLWEYQLRNSNDLRKILLQKIYQYNRHDLKKERRYYSDKFKKWNYDEMTLDDAIYILINNNFSCYYCNVIVTIKKKDNKQLSFDRINNKEPHHRENLLLACVRCNIGRGDMFTSSEWKIMRSRLP